jgi:Carboxypeptidase regulatory-like domain
MNHSWRIVTVCVLCAIAASAQTSPARDEVVHDSAGVPFSVAYQKQIAVPIAGATAAYSLDPNVAEASAANGIVQIQGRGPGTANVIVVTAGGVQTLAVVVPQPPPSYPPGFEPPSNEAGVSERGAYEVRYNSSPGQLTNSIEFTRTQGDSFNRLQVTNATLFSSNSFTSSVGFPLASYEISRPHRDVTLIDQLVNDAPLTVDGYLVRGLHVREGPWEFHGGFTSVAVFQGLFLATDPEYLAGISRTFSLHNYGSLEGGFYYFQNPRSQLAVAANGGLGSVTYRLKHGKNSSFLAQLGTSHWGIAFATRGRYETDKTHIAGNFRVVPQRFASLAVNNLHGTFGDLNASRDLSSRLFLSANSSLSDFNLPVLQQKTFTTGSNLTFKLTRNFSLLSGGSYSDFQSRLPAGAAIRSLNIPIGIDFSSRHIGGGYSYQRTENFDGSGGNDYSVNLRGAAGNFLMSAFFRHDVQVPTIASVFAQIPGLQDLLERAGIIVTSPDQLAELLNNTALLATLGFTTPLTVNLAPARNDLNASVSWMGRGPSHPQISLSYFDSRTQLIQGAFNFSSSTLSYSQRISKPNEVVASVSLLRTVSGGASPDLQPVFSVSLRHRFSSVPGLLLPGRHGTIQGHVFRDDESSARYGKQPGLAGIEIALDDARTTHTDANGYYAFHHVPFGAHSVEAELETSEPFFHTTDSPATAPINSTVDFGINFAKGQLFGFLLNDAGAGILGVTVELQGAGAPRMAQTTMEGKFTFQGIEPGAYTVTTLPASYPPGYVLQDLKPVQARVEAGRPERVDITIKAIRAIAGKVTRYDRTQLKPVPVSDATVRVKELSLETKTGGNGAYLFRNLPAGTYTLSVTYQDKEITRSVAIPRGPANLRDIDLDLGTVEDKPYH